jgi:DNA adenine methylase
MERIEHVGEHKVLKPILCFPGGKSKLARILMSGQYIPKHRVYVEPFFGGGSVFFAKPLAEVNVINDIDEQLISFYREFRELPKFDCDMTPDEKRFYDLKERLKNREHLEPCDYQYLNRWSVNCKMESFSRKKRPT